MMKTYEEEMFDFFASEEAFINLCKIAKHLPMVKAKLLEEFWKGVEKELSALCATTEDWKIIRLEPLSSGISKLMLFKSSWGVAEGCPQLAIGFEELSGKTFYGPFVHNRVPELNYTSVISYLRSLPIASDYDYDATTWYPFWDNTEVNFRADEAYLEILPPKSDTIASQFAKTLFDLGTNLGSELDYCNREFRKAALAL